LRRFQVQVCGLRCDRALRACAARVTLQRRCALSSRRPDGEIGRHCGLKIRRFPEKGRAGSTPARGTTKSLFNVFLEIALECNRDGWMIRLRSMGSCPSKQPWRQNSKFIGPISFQPCGQVSCRAACGVAALANSQAIGRAPRLAAHPGKVLVGLQKDIEQALGFNHVKLQRSL
jgi:hypothetical protein